MSILHERLQFYHMDERLFGQDTSLADTLQVFGLGEERENHENDRECIATLIEDLPSYGEGNIFIVFFRVDPFWLQLASARKSRSSSRFRLS